MTPLATERRRCRYCGEDIPDGKRLDAEFCSDLCRGRNHRDIPPETATNGFPGKRQAPRRPTREGRGVRPYILPEDSPSQILSKVDTARGRCR